ncbi:putative uncharacterized protein DDB_G0282133 isoform X1 [Ostrinia furnacalis]|uniref:putative uncharacterized protein DDB_G0282133 isoform X1 n=1 Tax=Ostrinia furnacalis TaxID=93504 RepID=UPI0010396349|nr:putative uncharacterized protein DDB_G0282133 isoform X1 [Ostrinia furnacalis]
MKLLLYGLSIAVIVTAKPELYREKEDFQYSRSSSDEGTKSGYYDAQRGNMGGNFERAHNMDTLAQHQMGGLVNQVQGELGDGYKTRTGSVFTAANSQGVYGQGRYDLSSLAGRNFQEGTTFHDSQSYLSSGSRAHSSQYSALNNARYNSDSLSHGAGTAGFNGFQQSDNLQAQNSFGSRGYEHGSESQRSSKYYLQSGYSGSNDYERSNLNQQASSNFGSSNTQNRLISTVPVRIVVRPGTRVAIPVATQTQQTQSGSHVASYDQINANNEAEVLSLGDHQSTLRPNGDAKHYESSYSYHKEWEKHDTKPVAVPVPSPVFPIAKNSELYDESRLHHGSEYTQNADYNNLATSQVRQQAGYNSQHSASSESRHQADYIAQQHAASSNLNQQRVASSNLHSNAYTQSGYNSDVNSQSANLIGAVSSKPKSYQSSYSYHKSWERQGDPYVIIPPSNGAYAGETNQRLTDLSGTQGEYSSHNYGSRKSHQTYSIKDCVIECDPNSHIRVARSYNSDPAQFEEQNQNINSDQESWGQQSQSQWDQQYQDAGQQVQKKWDNLEDLGQQTQNKWDQLSQDAGQQVQNKWDNLEDLGQQTQNKWDQFSQDAGQQVQNKWDNLEDLGQQTQNKWDQLSQDAGQQAQNKWDNLEDLGQQTQNKWDFGQQTQTTGQEVVNGWNNLESQKVEDQQTQDNWNTQTQTQEGHSKPVGIDDVGQHADTPGHASGKIDQEQQVSFEGTQQTEHKHDHFWDKVSVFHQSQASDNQMTLEQTYNQHKPQEESQTLDLSQQTQGFEIEHLQMFENHNSFYQSNNYDKTQEQTFQTFDLSQQTEDKKLEQRVSFDDSQQIERKNISFWDKISDFDQTQTFDSQKTDEHTLDQEKSREQPFETLDLSQQTQNNWDTQKQDNNNFGQFDHASGHSLGKQDQEQQVSFVGTQQTEQKHGNFWDNVSIFQQTQASDNQRTYEQTLNQQKPQEESQTLDLGQQSQGFEIEQAHHFDNQNGFDKTDLNQQTQSFWNHFTDSQTTGQTNTQEHKNTGSLNGLWGKLDDLDGDISPSSVNFNTPQDSGLSETSTSEHTHNWNQESSISHDTSSRVDVNEQNVNHHHNTFYDKLNPYKDLASDEVENDFLVIPTLSHKHDITTEKSIDEDNFRPVDFGRGDIGSDGDDSLIYVTHSTAEKTSVDNLNHKHTTENYEDSVERTTNENNLENNNRTSDKPYKKDLIHASYSTTEETRVENFDHKYTTENYDNTAEKATHENNLESYRPSDKPSKKDVSVEEVPEDFEQQFETQNVKQGYQLNEHKFDFSNQNAFQQQNSDQEQQNAEFKPEHWEQFSSHKYGHKDYADQQFVDFSQTNQQWHFDQQNVQQQFPDDFYQQNQDAQLQNSHTDFEQHNVEESPLSDFGQETVKSEFEILPVNEEQEKIVKKDNIEVLAQQPITNNIQEKSSTTTPQTITEKPGFWKSVGNKFASAKDKVASWFN